MKIVDHISLAPTIHDLLDAARDRMEAAGCDAPWLTAIVLLRHAAGLTREQILAHPERRLLPDQRARFERLVERRCRREPLAYLVGEREFFGRRFAITTATLIPRPETEGLVALALAHLDHRTEGRAFSPDLRRQTTTPSDTGRADARGGSSAVVLDVGTGSGAI